MFNKNIFKISQHVAATPHNADVPLISPRALLPHTRVLISSHVQKNTIDIRHNYMINDAIVKQTLSHALNSNIEAGGGK